MWTSDDFDNLLTFSEFLATDAAADIYTGTGIDETTQSALKNRYFYRKICDNTKFPIFYKRTLTQFANQYNNYIRIATTEFDPMVADYMERQIKRVNTVTGTGSTSGKQTTSGTGKTTTTTAATGSSSGSRDVEVTGERSETTSGTASGTTSGTTGGTSKTEASGTTGGTSETNGESTGTETADTATMNGDNPASSVNSDGAFPDALDWHYLANQSETKDTKSTTGTTKETGKNTGTSSDTSETTTTGTSSGESSETTSGTTSGTDSTTTTETTSGITKDDSTTTTERTDAGTVGTEGTSEKSETGNSTDRERYTGRHEAPQDMMARALQFIENCNAFEFLCGKLETCFMMCYDID